MTAQHLTIKADFIGLSNLGHNILKAGIRIENKAYWPVTAGTIISTPSGPSVCPEDGVIIREYVDGKINRNNYRYIKNSFYDDFLP